MSQLSLLKYGAPSSQVSQWMNGPTFNYPSRPRAALVGGFIQRLSNTSNYATAPTTIFLDGNDLYTAGFMTSLNTGYIIKMNDTTGAITSSNDDTVWRGGSSTTFFAKDSGGILYWLGQTSYLGTNSFGFYQFNSSFSNTLAKALNYGNDETPTGLHYFAGNNTFILTGTGNQGASPTRRARILQIATNATVSSSHYIQRSTLNYAVASDFDGTYLYYLCYNDNDAILWLSKIDISSGVPSLLSNSQTISVGANYTSKLVQKSGKIYISTRHNSGPIGVYDMVIMKFSQSGTTGTGLSLTLDWARAIGTVSGYEEGGYGGVVVDSSDNVYNLGYGPDLTDPSGDSGDLIITKYDSSGTLQWQRAFDLTTYEYPVNVILNSAETFLYITFQASNRHYLLKVPTNGGGVGTYTIDSATARYKASSYSTANFTPTVANTAVTMTTQSVSNNANNQGLTTSTVTAQTRVPI